jgi:hypothetical protein
MKVHAALLSFFVLTGCGAKLPTLPTTAPSSQPPSRFTQVAVGQVMTAMFEHGDQPEFDLITSSAGTLAIELSWTPLQGGLELWFAGELVAQSNKSPIVAKLPVVAGGKYHIRLADHAAWDYDQGWWLRYALTTAME